MSDPTTPVFYWRPGCPFCTILERGLDQRGIPLVKRNIWHDPEAAAAVRAVADGNETVPTVVVDEVAMVNPSAAQVAAEVARVAPHLLLHDPSGDPEGGRVDGR